MEHFNPAAPEFKQKADLPSSEQKNFRDDTESGVGFVKKEAWDFWRKMKHYQKLIDRSSSADEGSKDIPATVFELMEDWAKEDELKLAHIELTDEERVKLVSSLQEKNFSYSVTSIFAGRASTGYREGKTLTHDGSTEPKTGDSIVIEGDKWRAGRREEFTSIDSIKRLVDRRNLTYDLNDIAFATIEKSFGIENVEEMECYFLDNILDSVVVHLKGQEEGILLYSQDGTRKTRFVSFCESMYGEEGNE